MLEVVPTIVPDTFADIQSLRKRFSSFLTSLHVDATDGVFAPNVTWTPADGEVLPDSDAISYRAHLMVAEPRALGFAFLKAGAKMLEAHAEAFTTPAEGLTVFDAWRNMGAEKIAIALKFDTPLKAVEPYLDAIDYVRLMTIAKIGTQGIPFDEGAIGRVATFHERYLGIDIAVDGGVSEENIMELAKAGATSFTAGSAIAKAKDPAAEYRRLLALAESAV